MTGAVDAAYLEGRKLISAKALDQGLPRWRRRGPSHGNIMAAIYGGPFQPAKFRYADLATEYPLN